MFIYTFYILKCRQLPLNLHFRFYNKALKLGGDKQVVHIDLWDTWCFANDGDANRYYNFCLLIWKLKKLSTGVGENALLELRHSKCASKRPKITSTCSPSFITIIRVHKKRLCKEGMLLCRSNRISNRCIVFLTFFTFRKKNGIA